MKTFVLRTLCVVVFLAIPGVAQEVISLYPGTAPGSTQENYPEKEYFSKTWKTDVVTNVTKPSLTIFKPSPELRNGTAVVICPGGGFMALSITSEGYDVAKYLAAKGVTAFVLKYRLAHTGEDATQEFSTLYCGQPEIWRDAQEGGTALGCRWISGGDIRSAARGRMGSFARSRRHYRILRRRNGHRGCCIPLRA